MIKLEMKKNYNMILTEKLQRFCNLLIYVAYHVTFYSVVETPTLPQVAFNSLMPYNNVSILYILSGEFS